MTRRVGLVVVTILALAVTACSSGTKEVSGLSERRSSTTQSDDGQRDDGTSGDGEAGDDAADPGASASEAVPGTRTDNDSGRSGVGGDAAGSADGGAGTGERPGNGPTVDAPGSGGGATSGTTAPQPTFVPDPDRYDTYTRLAREYGAEVASREDAAGLASLFCSDPARVSAEYLDGQPLITYPSDLAIVRAYCPEAESAY